MTDGIVIGLLIGWIMSLLVMVFFDIEIFYAIDYLRKNVRSFFKLDKRL
jgi:hypothetical protein